MTIDSNSTYFAYNPDASTLGLDVAVAGGQVRLPQQEN